MHKIIRKIKLFILFGFINISSYAQVGINNDHPDGCSIFQVSHTSKGVIFPQISDDAAITGTTISDGLLYYNTTEHRFRFYNNTSWQCLNSWSSTTNPNVIVTDKQVSVNNTLTVSTSITVGTTSITPTTVSTDNITSSLTIAAPTANLTTINSTTDNTTTVNATTVNATTVNGFGTIPLGGIIMWSGTTPPSGWALCDGSTQNSILTPDLRGRFIVGYAQDWASKGSGVPPANIQDANYQNMNAVGGEKLHVLTEQELAPHAHGIQTGDSFNGGGDAINIGQGNGTKQNILLSKLGGGNPIGSDAQAHENRPPYYTLAFIMRIN